MDAGKLWNRSCPSFSADKIATDGEIVLDRLFTLWGFGISTCTGNRLLDRLWPAWEHLKCSPFLGVTPMPDIGRTLPANEVHMSPMSLVPSRLDSNLSDGVNYFGFGCGLRKTVKNLDQLQGLVIQAEMRVSTVWLHFMNRENTQASRLYLTQSMAGIINSPIQ
jgi:hypothetical protein